MATIKPVKIQKRGKNYQLYYYNPMGERRRISVGSDRDLAQRRAIKYSDWLLEGKDPEEEIEKAQEAEDRKHLSLRDFFPIFLKRHGNERREKTRISYNNSFKNVSRCPRLVDAELGSVTKGLVLDYMNLRKDEGVTPATVNREKALLTCMLSCAVEWEIIDDNPLRNLKSFKESGKRDIEITDEQVARLIELLPESVAAIVLTACYTGFRLENILSLRIEDIRFHDLTSTGDVSLEVKGGRQIRFPLGERAVEIINQARGNRSEGYVFINPITKTRYISIKSTFNQAVMKANLKAINGSKLRFHDLRHVFSNWLHQDGEGATLDQLRSLLGHKDRATTDRYVTVNHQKVSKVLSLLPNIQIKKQKSSSTGRAEAV
jgi:integrase